MNNEYEVRLWQDDIYAVYNVGDTFSGNYLFKGTLPEVNAWLSLKEKGYNV